MREHFQTPHFQEQLLLAIQRADLSECLETASQIDEACPDSWHDAWRALADQTRQHALKAPPVSAREGLLRATEYYRLAEHPLRAQLDDPRVTESSRHLRETFRSALELLDTPAHSIEIPYQETTLPGYLFYADHSGEPAPTLLFIGGYDSWSEEGYFHAKPALERGYNALIFDAPGQGHSLREKKLYLRPDFEQVITPVLDWTLAQEVVESVALIGHGLGGHLAFRAAHFDARLSAAICHPQISHLQTTLPEAITTATEPTFFEELFHRSPTQAYFFKSRMACHGLTCPLAYLEELARYSCEGATKCPTLDLRESGARFTERAYAYLGDRQLSEALR